MSKSNDKTLRAVALKYEAGESEAPCVVASGTGDIAQKILKVAMEHGVSIYHDESASTLLGKLDLGEEIPPELYQIVANIYISLLDIAEENSK